MSSEKDDLRVRTARAGMSMAGLTMILRPLSFIGSILLARWLSPDDFGAVALASLVVGLGVLFTDLGLSNAVVHSQEDRAKISFYAFSITSIAGLVMFLLIVANAVPIANLLGDVTIVPYLRWIAVLVIIRGLLVVPSALMRKDLSFGRIAQIGVVAQLFYLAIALSMAYLGYGIWSLIVARIVNLAVTTVLTWIFSPGWEWIKPKPIDKPVFRGLVGYGLQATGGQTLGYIIGNWDDWLVGRYLGTTSLGFYRRAYDYMDKNVIQLSGTLIGGVLLSTFAKLQDNIQRLKRIYLRANRLIWLAIVPISFGVAILAPLIVPVLLGAKWTPMITTLQIFSLMIMTRAFSFNTSSLFSAVGKPEVITRGGFILLAGMVPLALSMLRFGINGVALAALIADVFGVIYFVYQVNRILPGAGIKTFTQGIPMLAAGIVMVLGIHFSQPLVMELTGGNGIISLIILVSLGAFIYLSITYFTQKTLVMEMFKLAWDSVNTKGRLNRFLPKKFRAT